MSRDTNNLDIDFPRIFTDRGRTVLERFGRYTFEDVINPRLSRLVHEVQDYWYDTFRPALTSFACEAVGGDHDAADTASLMIALAGAGIGVHDDIIDSSIIKYTRKTILEDCSRDEALILGDLFIVKGLTLGRNLLRDTTDPIVATQVIALLDKYFTQLCEGELLEISYRKTVDTDLAEYHKALWKLGCCLEACTRIGGLMGGGSQSSVDALGTYGGHLGYVVRLAEEVKDTINLGNNLAHRLQYESVPLPLLYAVNVKKSFRKDIKSILEKKAITGSDTKKIIALCFKSGAFTYIKKIAEKNVISGLDALNKLYTEVGEKKSFVATRARRTLDLVLRTAFPIR